MTRFRRCDVCGKEAKDDRRALAHDFVWIDVEADEDVDHFDACSWACVAEMALAKAARDVAQEGAGDA